MIKIVLLLFLIGHILGDFYLQSTELALSKNESFKKIVKQSMIYSLSIILVILPMFNFGVIKWIFIISIVHFLLGLIKLFMKGKIQKDEKSSVIAYLADQIIKIMVIVITVTVIYLLSEPIGYISYVEYLLSKLQINVSVTLSWILTILIIIKPFSVTIKKVLYNYKPASDEEDGYPNAGALIGILERCVILLMLSVGQYAAIGFVLTAKSIARYNKIGEDARFSEYYLLGTLLSTMLVIVTYLTIIEGYSLFR